MQDDADRDSVALMAIPGVAIEDRENAAHASMAVSIPMVHRFAKRAGTLDALVAPVREGLSPNRVFPANIGEECIKSPCLVRAIGVRQCGKDGWIIAGNAAANGPVSEGAEAVVFAPMNVVARMALSLGGVAPVAPRLVKLDADVLGSIMAPPLVVMNTAILQPE